MLGALSSIVLAATATPAAPADPLAPLSAYQGVWRADITQLDSPFGKASHSVNTLRNDCWRATRYYACAQTVDGVQANLQVFTYDKGAYAAYGVPADGAPPHGPGKLIIEGDTWYFPWDEQQAGATVHMRVVNHFVGRDTIEFRSEYSRDGAVWTVTGRGLEKRQGAGG